MEREHKTDILLGKYNQRSVVLSTVPEKEKEQEEEGAEGRGETVIRGGGGGPQLLINDLLSHSISIYNHNYMIYMYMIY